MELSISKWTITEVYFNIKNHPVTSLLGQDIL